MKIRTSFVCISLTLTVLAGCGGSDSRPSVDSIAGVAQTDSSLEGLSAAPKLAQNTTLQFDGTDPQITKSAAKCVAEILRDSDASDAALAVYVARGDLSQLSKDDVTAITDASSTFEKKCKES